MNERIEKLAIEAGLESVSDDLFYAYNENLERFAELVRQDEREACAKLCEELGIKWHISGEKVCAAAIRGRTG
jgi:hypothetical protein